MLTTSSLLPAECCDAWWRRRRRRLCNCAGVDISSAIYPYASAMNTVVVAASYRKSILQLMSSLSFSFPPHRPLSIARSQQALCPMSCTITIHSGLLRIFTIHGLLKMIHSFPLYSIRHLNIFPFWNIFWKFLFIKDTTNEWGFYDT